MLSSLSIRQAMRSLRSSPSLQQQRCLRAALANVCVSRGSGIHSHGKVFVENIYPSPSPFTSIGLLPSPPAQSQNPWTRCQSPHPQNPRLPCTPHPTHSHSHTPTDVATQSPNHPSPHPPTHPPSHSPLQSFAEAASVSDWCVLDAFVQLLVVFAFLMSTHLDVISVAFYCPNRNMSIGSY